MAQQLPSSAFGAASADAPVKFLIVATLQGDLSSANKLHLTAVIPSFPASIK
jgi:hypothetical protein